MSQPANPDLDVLLKTLRASHERLATVLATVPEDEVTSQSYDDEWSIAQVASHLGSGAEIFLAIIEAGRKGEPAPGVDVFQPVWAVWNEKAPADQARDVIAANVELLELLDATGADGGFRLELFGRDRDLADISRMRLGEHAVHTWDIAVAVDPTATVSADAVEVIVDNLLDLVKRTGKWTGDPVVVRVVTHSPDRAFTLELSADGANLRAVDEATDHHATLSLPAEAFVRLVYGRLDADHTPAGIEADNVELDALRAAFPGF